MSILISLTLHHKCNAITGYITAYTSTQRSRTLTSLWIRHVYQVYICVTGTAEPASYLPTYSLSQSHTQTITVHSHHVSQVHHLVPSHSVRGNCEVILAWYHTTCTVYTYHLRAIDVNRKGTQSKPQCRAALLSCRTYLVVHHFLQSH